MIKQLETKQTSIFYADDDIDDLDFFREVTAEINQTVSLFEEGQEMLSCLNNPPPNPSVIFLDLNMPVKSGFDVLQEIKSSSVIDDVPVIILTTSANPADVQLCRNLGASLYIKKPSSISALKKAISYVMAIDWNDYIASEKDFVYKH